MHLKEVACRPPEEIWSTFELLLPPVIWCGVGRPTEKSAFVFEHRWLIVRRRDRMSDQPAGRPGDDAGLPARVEGPAGFRGQAGDAVRGGAERGVGPGASWGAGVGSVVPGGARVGQGDRGVGG